MTEFFPVVAGCEHQALDFSFAPEIRKWAQNAEFGPNKFETLGLYKTPAGEFAPGNFLGAVHIGEGESRAALCVSPKSEFADMDYLKMFLDCAAHPVVGGHMRYCLDFWPEKSPIETNLAPEFCGLVAAAFLRELNELRVRHFRRHFTRESMNFTGRARGKILVAENIRQNTARMRNDRIFCAFQSVSDDIPENRILRVALERAAALIANNKIYNRPILHEWIRAGRAALQGVSSNVKIFPSDHKSARKNGAFSHYRRPLQLARTVLDSSGFHLHGIDSEEEQQAGVSPFALNSAELFERWAQVKLLESAEFSELQAGYEKRNTFSGKGGQIAIRPDFWLRAKDDKNPAMILDAKYKSAPQNFGKVAKKDIYQMVAYSRHRAFLKKLHPNADKSDSDNPENGLENKPENKPVELALLYPHIEGGGEGEIIKSESPEKSDTSFHASLSMWMIPCPAKSAVAEEDRAAA